MNWYKQSNRNDLLKKFSWDEKNQEKEKIELGDVLRYTMDSHDITISINKTDEEITLSLTMSSPYVGTYILDYFWIFDIKEEDKARELYKNINKGMKPILLKFIKEKIPTSLLSPYLKEMLFKLKTFNLVRTNIPSINYSYDLPIEKDWRSTIYGTRYPKYKEESFKQYLNSSIYNEKNISKGKFIL